MSFLEREARASRRLDGETFVVEGAARAAWIFDIDGCLTEAWPNGQEGKRDWYDYQDCLNDPPNRATVQIALSLKSHFDLIFITARPERFWIPTYDWLRKLDLVPYERANANLFMAPPVPKGEAALPDAAVKRALYERNVARRNWAVQGVFEDRRDCALMYLDLGLAVFEPVDWRKRP